MPVSPHLVRLISEHSKAPDHAALGTLNDAILGIYTDAVDAILVYGSCLRSGNYYDGLVDLYVVVDNYKNAYNNTIHRLLNQLLAPNVFYLEVPFEEHVIRTKYAVISSADFRKGTSTRRFHSYLWGRFAQPATVAYARNVASEKQIYDCLAQSVITFCLRVLPRLPPRFSTAQLWCDGLGLSYAAELRAEKLDRTQVLFEAAESYYEAVTSTALETLPYTIVKQSDDKNAVFTVTMPQRIRYAGRAAWGMRRLQGKLLSVLRLLKALVTFRGGVDYIVWKLERHSGEKIELSPRMRRYPVIFIWGLFWRLYRRGIFR
ncbi:MAG: hypothetical protein V3S33_08005 [Gammaproteobacteria bacterium]